MKNSHQRSLIILAMLFIALNAPATLGQMKAVGEVVELDNIKTVVVAVPGGRLRVEMQNIAVPESNHSLHSVVKNHVNSLLLGKTVEVETRGLTRGKVIGTVRLNGVDVCLQMLRDGAAWHLPIEISGQSRSEFDLYAASASLARQEKRGVWALAADAKPPWEIRAERDDVGRNSDTVARRAKPVKVAVSRFQARSRAGSEKSAAPAATSRRSQMDAWVTVFAGAGKEPYGIQTYKDPQGRFEAVYTSPAMIDFADAEGKEKLECRGMYLTVKYPNGSQASFYLIALRAITDDYRFSKGNTRLSAQIDKQTVSLGTPFGFRGQGMIGTGGVGSQELMYFKTSNAVLKKIGNGKTVEFRINKLTAALTDDTRDLFWQLAAATN